MKHRYLSLSLLFTLLFTTSLNAQDFLGLRQMNYSGVHGIDLNPANVVDSRYRMDINLAGASAGVWNNYLGASRANLQDTNLTSQANFFDDYVEVWESNRNKSIYVNTELQLPSFMFNFNEQNAGAFTMRWRTMANIDGISPELALLIKEQLEYPSLWVSELENPNLSIQTMTWVEYGLTYGRVLREEDQHFIKVGGRVKFLQGLGAGYFFMKNARYEFQNSDTISVFSSEVDYGHSTNFEIEPNNLKYRFISKPGLGLDVGIVYEYRPDWQKHKFDMDGETDLWRRDENKYKFKAGFSITDIGSIKFDKGDLSTNFIADITLANIDTFDHIQDVFDFDSTMNAMFGTSSNDERQFRMNLPTAMSFQFDYHIWKDLYINFTPFFAVQWTQNENKVHYYTNYSLTPRYDYKWAGISIPLSYSPIAGERIGLGLRAGPILIGTSNINALFKNKAIYGGDLWAAVKVPIPHGRVKDDDEDKVSNKKDECPEIAGVWQFKGCPDTDLDGIRDTEDECPAEAGLLEFNGCPDTDKDGLPDKIDKCPTVPGLKEFEGCPDKDGDGIQDSEDDCPEVAGLKEFNGCPDTDGDGIIDSEDLCPEVPGPKENDGCPDTDGDGIFDYLDECPTVPGPGENKGCPWPDTDGDGLLDKDDKCPNNPGPVENEGCPYADTDGDGVLDKDDKCPNVPGVVENFGCPKIAEEEQEILNTAFDNLEFETGKDIIRNSSFPSLVELADLLKKKSEWKLLIVGHTDNVGSERGNLILSKKRATAVQKFLMDNGVPEAALTVEYYGETRPIADNDTEEGRQKNRRVEMTVVFE